MNMLLELLLNIRGLRISDELFYLFDLISGLVSRRLLRLSVLPGRFLLKDVRVIVKGKENSLFLCRAKTDELLHVMPYYEQNTWKFIKSIVTSGDVCIDVGSHIGTYTIPLARIVGHTGLVVAVEPSPLSEVLSFNAKLNGLRNIIVINKAAYSERKLLNFYFHPMATGISSLYEGWKSSLCKGRCMEMKVNAMPLDELLIEAGINPNEVKLLKIDVEGAEEQVLKGAEDTLKITKFVVFETSDQRIRDCIRMLKSAGFRKIALLERSHLGLHNFLAMK